MLANPFKKRVFFQRMKCKMFSLPPFFMFALLPNVTFKTVFHGTKQEYKDVPGDILTGTQKKIFQNIVPRVLQNVPACQKNVPGVWRNLTFFEICLRQ